MVECLCRLVCLPASVHSSYVPSGIKTKKICYHVCLYLYSSHSSSGIETKKNYVVVCNGRYKWYRDSPKKLCGCMQLLVALASDALSQRCDICWPLEALSFTAKNDH